MSVSLVYRNLAGDLLQVHDHAVAARISDDKGHWCQVFYNRATERWEIETDSVHTLSRIEKPKS